MGTDPASSRIWRLRKLHQQADARLREDDEGAELQFFYNGVRSPTRADGRREFSLLPRLPRSVSRALNAKGGRRTGKTGSRFQRFP